MPINVQAVCEAAYSVVRDTSESEPILCLVACILSRAACDSKLDHLGGPLEYAATLLGLIKRAVSHGDAEGRGCWLQLLCVAARSLAKFSGTDAGRLALAQLKGVTTMLSVLRLELSAYQALTHRAAGESPAAPSSLRGSLITAQGATQRPSSARVRSAKGAPSSAKPQRPSMARVRPSSAELHPVAAPGDATESAAAQVSPLHVINDCPAHVTAWLPTFEAQVRFASACLACRCSPDLVSFA